MSARRKFCEILLEDAELSIDIVDSRATRSLDERTAGNVIYSESSSTSEAEQEKDDASVCERMKPSNDIKTAETVSCLQFDSVEKKIFKKWSE